MGQYPRPRQHGCGVLHQSGPPGANPPRVSGWGRGGESTGRGRIFGCRAEKVQNISLWLWHVSGYHHYLDMDATLIAFDHCNQRLVLVRTSGERDFGTCPRHAACNVHRLTSPRFRIFSAFMMSEAEHSLLESINLGPETTREQGHLTPYFWDTQFVRES